MFYFPLQTRLEMQKALEEDSTVYEYDNVYDDIQKERLESNKKLLGGEDKKVYLSILTYFKPCMSVKKRDVPSWCSCQIKCTEVIE